MFDQEFTKSTFLTDPRKYCIGLTNDYFSYNLVTRTIMKGMFNGMLTTLFVYQALNGHNIGSTGLTGDFWVSGTLIYAIVVVNANLFVM